MKAFEFNTHCILLICCIFRAAISSGEFASAEHLGNSTAEEPTKGDYEAQIFMEYFRWHGVHNIMLIVCPQDVGKHVICGNCCCNCSVEMD